MTFRYDHESHTEGDMTVNTQFAFSEGHIRLLIWMCDAQADFIERAVDEVLEQGDQPTDNLMHCREGVADLKCWALRLLDALEEEQDYDEEEELSDDEIEDLYDPQADVSELETFRDYLKVQWQKNRSPRRPERRTALQGFRSWVQSLLQRFMAS